VNNFANIQGDPQLLKNANFLKNYVDRGDLGVKSGRGFYTYPAPAFQQPDFLNSAQQFVTVL
jgi:3-hydroxybutyryl-CoA dehydrogenase